jgi:acyl-CoA synthetase (AMP-forming)/AMP-acid ligase II
MIPLAQLQAAPFPPDHVVALRGAERLTWARFRAEVGGAAHDLAAYSRVALSCQDTWRFAVNLFALLSNGATIIVPANAQPETLTALAWEVDRIIDDDFVPSLGEWRAAPVADQMLLQFHTSGSTGASKRIGRSLAQMDVEIAALDSLWGKELEGAPTMATVPHQHVYGLTFKLLWPLAAGRPFFTRQHDLWEDVLADLPPGAILVTSPSHLTRLGGLPPVVHAPRLVLSAGAPLPEAAALAARDLLRVPVSEIYGSTETGAIATRKRDGDEGAWSPLPCYGIRRNGAGLLELDAFGETITLADRIDLEGDGRFHLRGRADRIAKIEGKRIDLDDVERILTALDEVETASVLVLKGATLAAVVVPSAAGRDHLDKLGSFRFSRRLRKAVGRSLEPAGLPRRWRFVESMPVAAMGKRRACDMSALFGEALRLPTVSAVRSTGGDEVQIDLQLNPDLYWFQGHFPGHPILPGVVQVDWALHFARTLLRLDLPAAREFQIKFKAIVTAGDTPTLVLRHDPVKGRLTFEYRGDSASYSSGTVYLT